MAPGCHCYRSDASARPWAKSGRYDPRPGCGAPHSNRVHRWRRSEGCKDPPRVTGCHLCLARQVKLASALKRVRPAANPVSPVYSSRSSAEKLGIKPATRVAVLDTPADYAKVIGPLSGGASLEEEPEDVLAMTLWF